MSPTPWLTRLREHALTSLFWLADKIAPRDDHWQVFTKGVSQAHQDAYQRPTGPPIRARKGDPRTEQPTAGEDRMVEYKVRDNTGYERTKRTPEWAWELADEISHNHQANPTSPDLDGVYLRHTTGWVPATRGEPAPGTVTEIKVVDDRGHEELFASLPEAQEHAARMQASHDLHPASPDKPHPPQPAEILTRQVTITRTPWTPTP